MKIELKNIDSLVPYWRNPRHNEEAVEALKILSGVTAITCLSLVTRTMLS